MTIAEYNQQQNELVNQLAKLREQGQDVFETEMKRLFMEYPLLKRISWTAYTPYFNDGDECMFSSHHGDASINGGNYCDEDYEDPEIFVPSNERVDVPYPSIRYDDPAYRATYEAYQKASDDALYQPGMQKPYEEMVSAVTKALASFDDDMYEAMFGDHVKVVVTRYRIEVESYEHD